MKYIVAKRYKCHSKTRDFNLPRMTECETIPYGTSDAIIYDGKFVCLTTSQDGFDYFSRNDDGRGIERFGTVTAIKKLLSTQDDEHQTRWDRLWDSEFANQFRREEIKDHWIWSYDFYNASCEDLKKILDIAKGE